MRDRRQAIENKQKVKMESVELIMKHLNSKYGHWLSALNPLTPLAVKHLSGISDVKYEFALRAGLLKSVYASLYSVKKARKSINVIYLFNSTIINVDDSEIRAILSEKSVIEVITERVKDLIDSGL